MNSFSDRQAFLKSKILIFMGVFLLFAFTSCKKTSTPKPNILWIYVEDLSPWMSCYGYEFNQTPNIDNLAKEGVQFTNAFMPSPVCSSTRSALITGTMQTTLGLHNHRSSRDSAALIYLPNNIKTLPELFKKAGYYSFNYNKEDYNFAYIRDSLYSGQKGHYYKKLNLEEFDWNFSEQGKPWFGQIMLMGGKSTGTVKSPINGDSISIIPYYPEHPVIRGLTARHFDESRIVDREVGQILSHLKANELLENTIVFFFSDHGWNDAARHKQFCYDGGLHVPLIVKNYSKDIKLNEGSVREDLVSGIDIATTSLALAGIEIPGHMEGNDLFARNFQPREYVISARDRCDYSIDRIRTVRTKQFRYIRNFHTDRSYMQPQYRDGRPFIETMKELYREGKMNDVQSRFMLDYRPAEELYDHETDPHETINLVGKAEYQDVLEKHRQILENWIKETDDKGQYPESEASLRVVYSRWGDKCVNPEYDVFR